MAQKENSIKCSKCRWFYGSDMAGDQRLNVHCADNQRPIHIEKAEKCESFEDDEIPFLKEAFARIHNYLKVHKLDQKDIYSAIYLSASDGLKKIQAICEKEEYCKKEE
jgi:hypothetical protein